MDGRAARIDALFAETIRVHEASRTAAVGPILQAVDALLAAFGRSGKALIFGNGGSAADALHFAAELVGRFERDRRGLAALALPADTSVLTSVANDYGFERVFARQVEALGAAGDVAIGISTSGASANVLAALVAARSAGMAHDRVHGQRRRRRRARRGHPRQRAARVGRARAGSAPHPDSRGLRARRGGRLNCLIGDR